MNLEKLLEIQGGLDAHIIKQHPEIEELENNDWKFLALQVELGELANEWRGFKVWSDDQEPRIAENEWKYPDGPPLKRNPLLEEYVDGLHFILSLGNDLYIVPKHLRSLYVEINDITKGFMQVYKLVGELNYNFKYDYGNNATYLWTRLYYWYLYLGNALGFSEKDIESAYLEKNLVNHKRQQNGY